MSDETTPLPAGEVLAAQAAAAAMARQPDAEPPPSSDPDAGPHVDAGNRRRWPVVAGVFVLLIAGIVAAFFVVAQTEEAGPPPPKPLIAVDVWVPYWTVDDARAELPERDGQLRQVSPFWLSAQSVDEIVGDPNATSVDIDGFVEDARSRDMLVVPTISDATATGEMASILADPTSRTAHVDAIAALASDNDYDGVDINYENFAFVDARSTWSATRPGWVDFIRELSTRLRADDRLLTVSIPFVLDAEQTASSGYWVYDPGAIAPFVDHVRLMAYDFSVAEPGPIAPLPWVETVVDGMVELVGDPAKVTLGIPLYGRNWPVFTTGICPPEAPGRTALSIRNADELIARRGATPVFDDVTAEAFFEYDLAVEADGTTTTPVETTLPDASASTTLAPVDSVPAETAPVCTQTRQVYYVDAAGVRARLDVARERQLGGVSLWALGFDDPAVWDAIAPNVERTDATSTAPESSTP